MSSKFLELAKKSEKLLDEYKKNQAELEAEMISIGLEKYIQDPETMAVYKIHVPSGTFMPYKQIDYKRTNVGDEKAGGPSVLSKKEAEEQGFSLKK